MHRRWLLLLAVAGLGAGCAASEDVVSREDQADQNEVDRDMPVAGPADEAGSSERAASDAVGEGAAAPGSAGDAEGVPAPEPTPPLVEPAPSLTTTMAPSYTAATREVTVEELGTSWRPGCPVSVEDLRRLDVRHWNGAGQAVDGALVVHADHAEGLVSVFERLFEAGFPIHSLRPITDFDSDDDRSMAANNSSAFNCREIAGRPGVWSQHTYGGAVDLNPMLNPWVRGSQVDPPGGAPFVDRTLGEPGMVVAGDVVTEAFAAIGWHWGGDWSSTLDYQHFSHNGR